jgi:SecD/SecF fusion protein
MIVDRSRVGPKQWISLIFVTASILGALLIYLTGAFFSYPLKYGMDLYGGVRVTFSVKDTEMSRAVVQGLVAEVKQYLGRAPVRITPDGDAVRVKFLSKERSSLTTNPRWIVEVVSDDERRIRYVDPLIAQRRHEIMNTVLNALRARIEVSSYDSASACAKGESSVEVEKPGVIDPMVLKEEIGRTGRLVFEVLDAEDRVIAAAEGVRSASPELSDARNPMIKIQMTPAGGASMTKATRGNIGKMMRIRMDGESGEISRLRINDELGDLFVVTGIRDLREIESLSRMIRAGTLPVPLEITEENVVGPTLGCSYIKIGFLAALFAMFAVWLVMIGVYGILGLVASFALVVNIALLLIFMALTGSVLTLPGIGGIALTAATAVDANVLINENLYALARQGKSWQLVVREGYDRAMETITNSNTTTLIAAAITYLWGSGPIKGFAVTWSIGLIISFITSVVLTRTLFEVCEPSNLPRQPLETLQTSTALRHPICRIRSYSTLLSSCGILLVLAGGLINPISWGIDFTGGVSMEVDCNLSKEGAQQALSSVTVAVQESGPGRLLIKTDTLLNAEKIKELLSAHITTLHKMDTVGPKLGEALLWSFGLSIILGLVCMWIYIAIAFGIPYAHTAIAGLIHDLLLICGIYTIFGFEFDEYAIVGMLSTIGYSINDTIVIFDAIKEQVSKRWRTPEDEDRATDADLVWYALRATMRRTLLTSISTAVALIVLCFAGYPHCILQTFALPLLIGVVVGTYSSICLVAPYLSLYGFGQEQSPANA